MNKVDEGNCGIRVSDVWIIHTDHKESVYPKTLMKATIGVDSGAAGIYDKEYYEKYHTIGMRDTPECEKWYDNQFDLRYDYDIEGKKIEEVWNEDKHCFVRTQPSRDGIVLDNKCVITDSGLGDGAYPAYCHKNAKGEIVGLRISFL